MNPIRRHLIAEIDSLIAHSSQAKEESHAGLKGTIREFLVNRIIQPILPPDVGVLQNGKIVDAYRGESREIDIALYMRRLMPSIAVGTGYIPIESTLCVIEVKSTVSATEIRDTIEKIKAIRRKHIIKE